jgi:hypothetical protein
LAGIRCGLAGTADSTYDLQMTSRPDPAVLLAHAMHTSPGVYVLLLGSGVSSAAGVPTGWAITLDLVRRLAVLEGADAALDPEGWYKDRFGEPPDYSELLNRLGATQAERQAIIRGYIEPTEDERAQGLKVPTDAHHSVSHLVKHGYVRVILTTNFDRLLEQALSEAGADFDVVANVDQLRGSRPIGQAPCLLVKLHGDYRDARILNTEAELASYPAEFDALLDRILDEFGLIVCGWSATWDPALREAIVRQPNRRYSTWWSTHGPLTDEAEEVAKSREATVLEGDRADDFFASLVAKIDALAELERPHPLTVTTAIAELKLYLLEASKRIRLRDLVLGEANRVHDALADEWYPTAPGEIDLDYLRDRVVHYEASVELLLALFAVGCAWVEDPAAFAESLERVANTSSSWSGNNLLLHLRRYPALLCLYAGGVAATHRERWDVLRALTYDAVAINLNERVPMAVALNQWEVFQASTEAQWLPEQERKHTPVSNRLYQVLRETLRETIPVDTRYEDAFDRFEYLLGLVIQDLQNEGHRTGYRSPVGCFGWRDRYGGGFEERHGLADEVSSQAAQGGEGWAPLRAGLFGGELDRFNKAQEGYRELLDRVRRNWLFS